MSLNYLSTFKVAQNKIMLGRVFVLFFFYRWDMKWLFWYLTILYNPLSVGSYIFFSNNGKNETWHFSFKEKWVTQFYIRIIHLLSINIVNDCQRLGGVILIYFRPKQNSPVKVEKLTSFGNDILEFFLCIKTKVSYV